MNRRLVAFVPNQLEMSPGQRVRIEAWAKGLPAYGWDVEFQVFEAELLRRVLYRQGYIGAKAAGLAWSYLGQASRLRRARGADGLFVYREAALIGPAVLERLLASFHAPLIYDIDDPIFLPQRSPTSGAFAAFKAPRKAHKTMAMADQVWCISENLAEYARSFNGRTLVFPNCLDTSVFTPASRDQGGVPTLLWSGSHSTLANLTEIAAPLRALQTERRVRLQVVGGTPDLPGVTYTAKDWSASEEVSDLQSGDIGLLPVLPSPGNRFKFFLKAIQYMAVGMPVVAQRAGANENVIEDGVTGFLVESSTDWHQRLKLLVDSPELRERMGRAARRVVEEMYSLERQTEQVAAALDGMHSAAR